MLPFDTTHAITGRLIDADAHAEAADWGAAPVLLVLHERRPATGATTATRGIRVAQIPVPDRCWHEHPTGIVGVLADLATHRPDLLRAIDSDQSDRALLGWAVMYEDIHAGTTDLTELRRVDALDIDGRAYQITHLRGEHQAVVVIDDHPTPAHASATHVGLAALLGAAHRP